MQSVGRPAGERGCGPGACQAVRPLSAGGAGLIRPGWLQGAEERISRGDIAVSSAATDLRPEAGRPILEPSVGSARPKQLGTIAQVNFGSFSGQSPCHCRDSARAITSNNPFGGCASWDDKLFPGTKRGTKRNTNCRETTKKTGPRESTKSGGAWCGRLQLRLQSVAPVCLRLQSTATNQVSMASRHLLVGNRCSPLVPRIETRPWY